MKDSRRYQRKELFQYEIDPDDTDFNMIAYTARALKSVGLNKLIPVMYEEASKGGHLVTMTTCEYYIVKVNNILEDEFYEEM